jgi:hypothetical protein
MFSSGLACGWLVAGLWPACGWLTGCVSAYEALWWSGWLDDYILSILINFSVILQNIGHFTLSI